MLDEEGRTRLKLKVCCYYFVYIYEYVMPVRTFESESYFVFKRVTTISPFTSLTGGEYYSMASQERWGGKWNTRKQRPHRKMVRRQVRITVNTDAEVVTLCTFRSSKLAVLSTACPSTWETKCLMFTKLLSRETTTTCSSGRVPDYRDRLCSKPNSHSGNSHIPLLYCRLLLRTKSGTNTFSLELQNMSC